MGDFHKYVMQSAVETFSTETLPGRSRGAVPDGDGVVDASWAGRWVAARAIELGWTDERFGEFERERRDDPGRAAHKPERFGKKYQWLALHELLTRLAANFQVHRRFDGDPPEYCGPWQWYGRDLDPTLDRSIRHSSHGTLVAPNGLVDWQSLSCASPDLDDPASAQRWADVTADFPSPASVLRGDGSGRVALHRFEQWSRSSSEGIDRDQWVLAQCWLVRREETGRVLDAMGMRGNWGRWMPEPDREHRSYLGEGRWAPTRRGPYADTWELLGAGPDVDVSGLEVLPAARGYLWEGGVTRDCSLEESITLQLLDDRLADALRWHPTAASYMQADGTDVATTRRGSDGQVLLSVDQAWLDSRLTELELDLVFSIIGERRATQGEDMPAWRPEESWGTEMAVVFQYVPAEEPGADASFETRRWPITGAE